MSQKKPITNQVSDRFLPVPQSVLQCLEPEPTIDDFHWIKNIGEGSFGKVMLFEHKKTKVKYAIKCINKTLYNNQNMKPYFRREIEMLYKINHPNIIKLYGHFEDEKNLYYILEYASKGSLKGPSIGERITLSAKKVAVIAKQVISALYYLHHMNPPIIHRDLKPDNLLVDKKGRIRLTDFGWSNYLNGDERSTYCGTVAYHAPEMIKEDNQSEKLDIWCLGILMFDLLTGKLPFNGKELTDYEQKILGLKINWPRDMNIDAKGLITKILKIDPKERLSLPEILQHPFFTKNIKDTSNILNPPSNIEKKPFVVSKDIPEEIEIQDGDSIDITPELNALNMNPSISISKIDSQNNSLNNIKSEWDESDIGCFSSLVTEMNNDVEGSVNQVKKDKSIDVSKYDKLLQRFYNLNKRCKDLFVKNIEDEKQIKILMEKEAFLQKDRERFMKEITEKENEKLQLLVKNDELNELISEKDEKIKNLLLQIQNLTASRDKNNTSGTKDETKDNEENKDEEDKSFLMNEEVAKELQRKIEELEPKSSTKSNEEENNSKTQKAVELIKKYFEDEFEKSQKKLKKDMTKLYFQLRVKEAEINFLEENQKNIILQESQKYKDIIESYEDKIKKQGFQIKNLEHQIKRFQILNSLNTTK